MKIVGSEKECSMLEWCSAHADCAALISVRSCKILA